MENVSVYSICKHSYIYPPTHTHIVIGVNLLLLLIFHVNEWFLV